MEGFKKAGGMDWLPEATEFHGLVDGPWKLELPNACLVAFA